MKVWLVNPFDALPGEQVRTGRYAYIAKMLSEAGHSIVWWTSSFSHWSKSYRPAAAIVRSLPLNITARFVPAPLYYGNVSGRRIISHFVWALSFYRIARRDAEPPDVILASSPPLLSARAAIWLAKDLSSKVVVDIQDLWPEAFCLAVPKRIRRPGRVLFWPLEAFAESTYRQADAVIAVSNTYLNRAGGKRRGFVIPLGIELDKWPVPSIARPESPFGVVYIGSLGESYDLDTVLVAASELRSFEGIHFTIMGDGSKREHLLNLAKRLGLENVEFTGWLAYEEMIGVLQSSHLGLNPIVPESMISWPNKVFDYLAAGLPVVSSVKGELAELIEEEGVGLSYEALDGHSLANAILTVYKSPRRRRDMAERAYKLALERFDRKLAYSKLPVFLEDLTQHS